MINNRFNVVYHLLYLVKKLFYLIKKNMKYKDKTREFEVKLESINPTGVVVKSQELSMMIVDDQESMINNNRLFIHIGECLYRIDKKGFIIERVIPIDNSK